MQRIFSNRPLTKTERNRRSYLNHLVSRRARNLAYHHAHKNEISVKRQLRQYNVSLEWLESKKLEQNNCCAICGNVFVTTPNVDHDHSCCSLKGESCGKCVRGLLCGDCNNVLGRAKDNIEVLRKAIKYLELWNERNKWTYV